MTAIIYGMYLSKLTHKYEERLKLPNEIYDIVFSYLNWYNIYTNESTSNENENITTTTTSGTTLPTITHEETHENESENYNFSMSNGLEMEKTETHHNVLKERSGSRDGTNEHIPITPNTITATPTRHSNM